MGILDNLNEWDVCAIGEGRYYLVFPSKGYYVRSKHFQDDPGQKVPLDPKITACAPPLGPGYLTRPPFCAPGLRKQL